MRLQVFSDLHLEFDRFKPAIKKPDAVVLAGDVDDGWEGLNWAKKYCRHCPVIYVLGNHEFYHRSIPDLTEALKSEARGSQVHVLENDAFVIEDFVFLGCTLWTDFRLWPDARQAMACADQEMSDFRLIQKEGWSDSFKAKDSEKIHAESVKWLTREMSRHDPARTIVVTHHAPSPRSIPPYHSGNPLNAAFASDLDPLIRASGVPLWIHGHTHYNVDYKIGTTRIYSNQRGYPNEVKKCFEPGDIIKVL